jgi:hypothetical protein
MSDTKYQERMNREAYSAYKSAWGLQFLSTELMLAELCCSPERLCKEAKGVVWSKGACQGLYALTKRIGALRGEDPARTVTACPFCEKIEEK